MSNVLLRGAVAGAVAGALTSLYSLLVTEPVLDRAIALEGAGEGAVSREAQKYLGGPAGLVLFGLSVGLLYALVYRVLPSTATAWRRALGLALGAWLVLALIPQLRYPANPPGVGDPDTISGRTSSYLLTYAVGLLVVSGGYAALRALQARGWSEPARQSLVVGVGAVAVGVAYALLPDSGDAVDVPAALLWDFRIRALGGLTLFFALLGAAFAVLTARGDRQRATARSARATALR